MISRRIFLTLPLLGTASQILIMAPSVLAAEGAQGGPTVTVLTKVTGSGEILAGLALAYDQPVASAKLKTADFAVANRHITKVYANSVADFASKGTDGRFVIIELSATDPAASLYGLEKPKGEPPKAAGAKPPNGPPPGGMPKILRTPASAVVTQTQPINGADGKSIPSTKAAMMASGTKRLVVDDFQQRSFTHAESGVVLKYNLFVPKMLEANKKYPLVNFMHDAGATSDVADTTLVQGLGAISFANPVDQAKHPAFVLAPQFSRQVVDDLSKATAELDAVVVLIQELAKEFPIDTNRLYTTGQSGGGMMSIAMNIKYPDFFAASFLVACQWDPTLVAPLAKDKLWVVVSEGDTKAFPGQNAIMSAVTKLGAKVSHVQWKGTYSQPQFAKAAAALAAKPGNIKYVSLDKTTVVPNGVSDDPGAQHINTWRIAYDIPGIRDWLFQQHKA